MALVAGAVAAGTWRPPQVTQPKALAQSVKASTKDAGRVATEDVPTLQSLMRCP